VIAEPVTQLPARLMRLPLVAGALFALLAVMAGAFGAHGLRNLVSERGLEVFQTAVTYQMYHALALLLVAALSAVALLPQSLLAFASGFFVAGILLFSGSLYVLALTDVHWLGPVTPVGGACFMVGWILLVIAGLRR